MNAKLSGWDDIVRRHKALPEDARVAAIVELIETWRDYDWAYEREPNNVDAPSVRSQELALQRGAARVAFVEALHALGASPETPLLTRVLIADALAETPAGPTDGR